MNNENTPSRPFIQRKRWLRWLAGMIVGNLTIAILYYGTGLLLRAIPYESGGDLILWPSFFLVPMFGGLVASYIWRRLNPRISGTIGGAVGTTLLGIVGAAIVFKEGIICLIIFSPLLLVVILAGTLIGRIWFKGDPTLLRCSVLPLLAVMAIGEPLTRTNQPRVVTDELVIHASSAKIWPELTAFPTIPEPPAFWLFRIGLPYPQSTTNVGDFVGADRRCIFSGGAVFKETIAEFVPRVKLTFDIVQIPKDPELMGHLSPTRGEFRLRDNGDGTCTLIGSTWYTLHVRPLWYFDWWTQYIFRAVHLRVMEDIRRRAEAAS